MALPEKPAQLIVLPKAEKSATKLKVPLDRLQKSYEHLCSNPEFGKPLAGPLKGNRSFRMGNFRIIYEYDAKAHTIYIKYISPRDKAYR